MVLSAAVAAVAAVVAGSAEADVAAVVDVFLLGGMTVVRDWFK